MGGSRTKDVIENLMGLCRTCHDKYGDRKQYYDFLINLHFEKLLSKNVNFNEDFFVTVRYAS